MDDYTADLARSAARCSAQSSREGVEPLLLADRRVRGRARRRRGRPAGSAKSLSADRREDRPRCRRPRDPCGRSSGGRACRRRRASARRPRGGSRSSPACGPGCGSRGARTARRRSVSPSRSGASGGRGASARRPKRPPAPAGRRRAAGRPGAGGSARRVASRTAREPVMWSKWACVWRSATGTSFAASSARRIRSGSSPGIDHDRLARAGSARIVQLHWSGPTGNVSMSGRRHAVTG